MPRTFNATLAAPVVGVRRACSGDTRSCSGSAEIARPTSIARLRAARHHTHVELSNLRISSARSSWQTPALDQFNLGIVFNEIVRWTLPTLPAGWETLRDPWEWYHSLRMAGSLLALACAFGSV